MAAPHGPDGREPILKLAVAKVALLAHLTPTNFEAELARVEAELASGRARPPEFVYARATADLLELAERLGALAQAWRAEDPVAALYADKADELALEARMCAARERGIAALARQRFQAEPELERECDELAQRWLAAASAAPDGARRVVRSDDEADPGSLVSRMREEVGRRRLPFRVVVARALAPLAAVGDGVIQIAPGRTLSDLDVERTVLHEIEGHALPAARALSAELGLLRVGSARGSDDQEGWALLVEERSGLLRAPRRAEIGARHLASRRAHEGRRFEETLLELARACADGALAVRSTCRAYRGGGLGREAAYLPALLRVKRAFADDPTLEPVLTSGRLSVEAARALAAL